MPTLRTLSLASVVLAASTLGASPAFAQQAQAPLAIPAPPPPPASPSGFRRPGMMAGGIVVGTVGALLLAGGAVMYAQGASACNADPDSCGESLAPGIGMIMMIFGGIHLLVGIPLVAVGAQRARPPVLQALIPRMAPTAAGARSTGLVWSF